MSGEYYLGGSEWAAARLRLQHELTKCNLDGHLLDPSIPPVKRPMMIADVGCGTGVWALDVAETAPELVQAEALDINLDEVPPKAWLPKNVVCHEFDLMQELPEKLVKRYDIINMQFGSSFIRDAHSKEVMARLVNMLKPGGYLQITDVDYSRWSWVTATGDTKPPEVVKLYELVDQTFGGFHQWKWLGDIETTFMEAGLQSIQSRRVEAKPSTRQPNMMNWMLAMLEAGHALSNHPTMKQHADALLAQRMKAATEARALGVGMDCAVTRGIGRKPSR
ncbi:hypothetical protein LTR56_010545 [Elasticomyces elasticus]|nr:hypothetical protein LTR56_010545 [Elasticomyces elasticus]KAK3657961.1 hypothetical protein LTR22_009188 [Elasticomyces elasticus]KAK5762868.1 hypothetical protein LTS12_007057 [Elasticomyces elasticus]